MEIDDFPTRRSGRRRVYGSTNMLDPPLAEMPVRGGDPLGRMIGRVFAERYEIDALTGHRLLGPAYRAVDRAASSERGERSFVTVTLLDDRIVRDTAALLRLRRAVGPLSRLDHPALDVPLRLVEADGGWGLVSRHRTGRTLADLLGRTAGAGWPLRSVLPIGYRVAEALAPAHAAGRVHGALDPASVLLTAGDEVVVLDLGLHPALTGTEATVSDDVLGLARLVLALLTGSRPEPHGGGTLRRPAGLRETAWAGLLAGLASDPALRPPAPEALMVSLEDPGWFRRLVGRRARRSAWPAS